LKNNKILFNFNYNKRNRATYDGDGGSDTSISSQVIIERTFI